MRTMIVGLVKSALTLRVRADLEDGMCAVRGMWEAKIAGDYAV
jgi:hypothetical protein